MFQVSNIIIALINSYTAILNTDCRYHKNSCYWQQLEKMWATLTYTPLIRGRVLYYFVLLEIVNVAVFGRDTKYFVHWCNNLVNDWKMIWGKWICTLQRNWRKSGEGIEGLTTKKSIAITWLLLFQGDLWKIAPNKQWKSNRTKLNFFNVL